MEAEVIHAASYLPAEYTFHTREVRRRNLVRLLDQVPGYKAILARRVQVSPGLVTQWQTGTSGIHDRLRDVIEDQLGLPKYWLDQPAASLERPVIEAMHSDVNRRQAFRRGGRTVASDSILEEAGYLAGNRRLQLRKLVNVRHGARVTISRLVQVPRAKLLDWMDGSAPLSDAECRAVQRALALPAGWFDTSEDVPSSVVASLERSRSALPARDRAHSQAAATQVRLSNLRQLEALTPGAPEMLFELAGTHRLSVAEDQAAELAPRPGLCRALERALELPHGWLDSPQERIPETTATALRYHLDRQALIVANRKDNWLRLLAAAPRLPDVLFGIVGLYPAQVVYWFTSPSGPPMKHCRALEQELGLPHEWLDEKHDGPLSQALSKLLRHLSAEAKRNGVPAHSFAPLAEKLAVRTANVRRMLEQLAEQENRGTLSLELLIEGAPGQAAPVEITDSVADELEAFFGLSPGWLSRTDSPAMQDNAWLDLVRAKLDVIGESPRPGVVGDALASRRSANLKRLTRAVRGAHETIASRCGESAALVRRWTTEDATLDATLQARLEHTLELPPGWLTTEGEPLPAATIVLLARAFDESTLPKAVPDPPSPPANQAPQNEEGSRQD